MPTITPVSLRDIKVGSSSVFRGDLNWNFDQIESVIQQIIDTNMSIVLSSTQPSGQRQGDLWLREL